MTTKDNWGMLFNFFLHSIKKKRILLSLCYCVSDDVNSFLKQKEKNIGFVNFLLVIAGDTYKFEEIKICLLVIHRLVDRILKCSINLSYEL